MGEQGEKMNLFTECAKHIVSIYESNSFVQTDKFDQVNSMYIGHLAVRAHLGPCERPTGRNNENLRKG